MWKDFFYFSRTEKQGIIVLVALIAIVVLTGTGLSIYNKQKDAVYPENAEEEYNRFIALLKEKDAITARRRNHTGNNYRNSTSEQAVILAPFDPNTADSITFRQLGLSPWIARNILRYRTKGGQFRTPEDFRKIYGLSDIQYTTLLPYIYISDEFRKRDTIRMVSEQRRNLPDTIIRPFKYSEGTTIRLNVADTTELKKIPGIGSGIAKRIVSYRNRLGGFYHLSQLQEINLNPEELSNWFSIRDGEIKRINLNKVSVERLMAHPYFNFYQAKVIVEYRKKKGNLKRLEQLAFYDEFTNEDMERMKHYICFE